MSNQTSQPALIYVRVSSKKQEQEGSGLASQETTCRELARRKGYTVEKVFSDDMTGRRSDRPGIMSMIAYLRRNKKTRYVVLLDDQSRLARNTKAYWTLREDLDLIEAQLESPLGRFKNDADSRLHQNMLASVYQHGTEKNQEQVISRMSARNLGGYATNSRVRGYHYVKVRGEGKMLVRSEPEASIIKEALEGFASGRFASQVEVKRYLEAHPQFRTGKSGKLHNDFVPNLLKNVTYAGYVEAPYWNVSRRKGLHEPLIDYATYQKIQDRSAGRAYAPARKDINEDFPLRGFVLCECEQPYRAGWSKGRMSRHAYYACHNKACGHYGKSIKRELIEGEISDMIGTVRPASVVFQIFTEMLRDLYEVRASRVVEGLTALKGELLNLERQAERLVDLILETTDSTNIARYEKRMRDVEIKKVELQEKVASGRLPQKSFDECYRTALEFLSNPLKLWVSGRIEDKRTVINLVFGEKLTYIRNQGYRTAAISTPIRLLRGFFALKEEMVEPRRVEP